TVCGRPAPGTPTSWTPCSRRLAGTQLWVKSVASSGTSSANIEIQPKSSRTEEAPSRMPTPGVGQDIEAMCGRCGQVWHVVMAKMGDKIAKVVCKRCGGHHRYRDENADTSGGGDASRPRRPTFGSARRARPARAETNPVPPFDP